MKLRTTVGTLLETYNLVSPTLDRKGASANLYLQANDKSGFLYLYSTNLLSETATKLKAEIESPGEALVNPSKLSDGLGGLPKDLAVTLTLTPTGNALKVSAGRTNFSLTCSTEVSDLGKRMKTIPSKAEPVTIIPASELAAFTRRSIFCIPNDQTGQRQSLSALKLSDSAECEEAIATDGEIAVRIVSTKKQSKGTGFGMVGLLIPSPALTPLASLVAKKRGETVAVILNENRSKVFFKFADGTYFGALTMATHYPNLARIFEAPASDYIEVSREDLKQVLNRASSFVAANNKILEVEISKGLLSINATGDDSISDQISIRNISGDLSEPVKLGINIDHLFNIVSGSSSEFLNIGFTSTTLPLVVSDHEGDEDERINIRYVVMGVRVGAKQ